MAIYKNDLVDINLETGNIHRSFLSHSIGYGDEDADRFGVRAYRNGTPEDIGGTCIGFFIRSTGDTVVIEDGVVSGNVAYVTLPDACYAVEGQFTLAIKCQGGGVTGTLRIVDGFVCRTSTDSVVDPGTIIPSIEDLIEAIDEAVASIPADYSSLWTSLAPAFDATASYKATQYVTYNGKVYRFTKDHSGSWASGDVVAVTLGGDFYKIAPINSSTDGAILIANGTDYDSILTNGNYYVNSANSAQSMTHCPVSVAHRMIVIQVYSSTRLLQLVTSLYGFYFRFYNGSAWGDWNVFYGSTSDYILTANDVLPSCDLNDKRGENHYYLMSTGNTYQNAPTGSGFLFVYNIGSWTMQVMYALSTGEVWKRRANGSTWGAWMPIAGGGSNVTNEYTFNNYNNSYTVTATPSITADTNDYLAPSGDTADRTNDIVTMLTQVGVCRLGCGDYYVSNLQMPDNSTIIGSGRGSRIILSGTSDGYAVKMGKHCGVHNVRICGSTSDITLSSTLGGRHGILWQGNYTETQANAQQPWEGQLSNLYIDNFTGGGITCYDTGYGTFCHMEAVNVYINRCNAGINVSYWSEFHKFTNCRTYNCWYGCINNGGNNVFVNCDFSSCKAAFLMDNSQGQSPNNSHGACIGCVFNHTNSNEGIGIQILDCDNGFIFDGCQIFFSQIDIQNSDGVSVVNSNFGSNNCSISISGGGAIIFANNLHQAAPTITVTNNSYVHFVNCYVRSTGAAVGP